MNSVEPALIELKEQQLINLASSLFERNELNRHLQRLLQSLKISKNEVIKQFVYYDFDINAYDNEVFESLGNRFVLYLHNLAEKSWHRELQQTIQEYIENSQSKTIIDIGFGVPSLYVKEALIHKKYLITLLDKFDNAFIFAKALLNEWSSSWKDNILFKKMDMNEQKFVGKYDLYLFSDSLEHINNSEHFLKTHIDQSSEHARFLFSLPIGPLIPMHCINWDTSDEIMSWLQRLGLIVLKEKIININPTVDLFTSQSEYNFKCYILLCEKKKLTTT